MRNVIIKKAMSLKLTGDDWDLYTGSRDCEPTAKALNLAIAAIINASLDAIIGVDETLAVARAGAAAGLTWAPTESPNGSAAQAADIEKMSVRRIISGCVRRDGTKGFGKATPGSGRR